jgi:hypothetical protein
MQIDLNHVSQHQFALRNGSHPACANIETHASGAANAVRHKRVQFDGHAVRDAMVVPSVMSGRIGCWKLL